MPYTEYADSMISLGHMFNQHYLDPMFPLSKSQGQVVKAEKGINRKPRERLARHSDDQVGDKFDESFLDRIVTPDERLAMERDLVAIAELGVARRASGLEFGSGQVLKHDHGVTKDKNADGGECLTFGRTDSGRVVAKEARGKTVKELSRLWKYLGGRSPMDHHPTQQKIDQDSGDGPALEQSPTLSLFDRPKSSVPHPSPTTDEQVFHVSSFSEAFLRHPHGARL